MDFARSLSTPIANKTWEGCRAPEEQAEPPEAQIPSKSSPARRESLSQPLTVKETVFYR